VAGVECADVGEESLRAPAEEGLRGLADEPADADEDETGDQEFARALEERVHREH